MKHAMVVLATVVALVIVGCQDNSVLAPTTTTTAFAGAVGKPHPTSNVIVLKGIVDAPTDQKGAVAEIIGQVWFVRNPVLVDNGDQFREQFDLTLQAEAEIRSTNKDGFSFKVAGASTDRIEVSDPADASPITLTKSYSFIDGDTQISLHLMFEVSSTDIIVRNMWLTRSASYDGGEATDGGK